MKKAFEWVLALDSDQAGQNAALDAGSLIYEITRDWGSPRITGEPSATALAAAQRAYSEWTERYRAFDAISELGAEVSERIDQSDYWCILLWDYCEALRPTVKPTLYTDTKTADEFAKAETIANTPMETTKPGIDFDAIKRTVDILEYIQRDTVLKQRGNKWYGRCPFPDHSDSTASFWVYPDTRSFYCFGCRRGGDVIDYAKHKGLGAKEL